MLLRRGGRRQRPSALTPAIAAGVSDRLWEIGDIVELIEKAEARMGGQARAVQEADCLGPFRHLLIRQGDLQQLCGFGAQLAYDWREEIRSNLKPVCVPRQPDDFV